MCLAAPSAGSTQGRCLVGSAKGIGGGGRTCVLQPQEGWTQASYRPRPRARAQTWAYAMPFCPHAYRVRLGSGSPYNVREGVQYARELILLSTLCILSRYI